MTQYGNGKKTKQNFRQNSCSGRPSGVSRIKSSRYVARYVALCWRKNFRLDGLSCSGRIDEPARNRFFALFAFKLYVKITIYYKPVTEPYIPRVSIYPREPIAAFQRLKWKKKKRPKKKSRAVLSLDTVFIGYRLYIFRHTTLITEPRWVFVSARYRRVVTSRWRRKRSRSKKSYSSSFSNKLVTSSWHVTAGRENPGGMWRNVTLFPKRKQTSR